MKILFGIQATGNGHIKRSETLIHALKEFAEVDVLMSGSECELLPEVEVNYRLKGLSFIFGKRGGVSISKTWNALNFSRIKEEWNALPILNYDLVVTDFEPFSNWKARLNGIPSIGVANQYASLLRGYPAKKSLDFLGRGILKNYALPDISYAYYYYPFNDRVCAPVIDQKLRTASVKKEKFTLVYLPAHDSYDLAELATRFPHKHFKIFGKRIREPYYGHGVELLPVGTEEFRDALLNCSEIITAAGFGLTTEALYLGKPLVVLPMRNQYEQQCNAVGLAHLGIPIIHEKGNAGFRKAISALNFAQTMAFNYPDHSKELAKRIVNSAKGENSIKEMWVSETKPLFY